MNRPLRIVLVAAALLAVATAASGAIGTYVDKKYGFSIKIAPKWSQTPLQPGEDVEAAKFKEEDKRDFMSCSIYRFTTGEEAPTTPSESSDGGEEETPEIPNLPPGYGGGPETAMEQLEQTKMIAKRYGVDLDFGKARKLKMGKIEGTYYEFGWKHPRMRSLGRHYVAGICEGGGEEYLILYSAPPTKAKKLKKVAIPSIRSFRLPGDTTKEADDHEAKGRVIADDDQEILDPEKRERVKKALVGTWDFIDTPHYIVVYNCDRPLAAYIAKRIEYMRVNAYEKVFPPVEPIKEAMVVRVCKEMGEYHHYGGPPGSAGYWASFHDELVFPDLSRGKKPDSKTIGVLQHEGFHQFIYYSLLKHDPPVWFNEGYAEYFYCVNSSGKRLGFEKRHDMRYGTVKTAISTGKFAPVADFIQLTQPQYYANAQLYYSQGWAFATWLKNVTRVERYQQVPEIYFHELQKGYLEAAKGAGGDGPGNGFLPPGRNNEITKQALEKAFEGIDLEEMNRHFLSDVKRKM